MSHVGEAVLVGAPGLLRPGAMRTLAGLPPEQREALAAAIRTVTDLIGPESEPPPPPAP